MNRIRNWMLVLAAAAALAVHIVLMPFAMPTAALHMTVDRSQAIERGRRVLTDLGLRPPGDARVAVSFNTDAQTKGWLEQRLGIAGSNRVAQREGLVYRWMVRFYRQGDPEQWEVELDPEGAPLGVQWTRPDDIAAPVTDDPQKTALTGLRTHFGVELDSRWRLVERLQTPLPRRMDHTLTWERVTPEYAGARQRVTAEVSGGAVVGYRRWLYIPDHLLKTMERSQSKGETLAMVAQALGLLFVMVILWALAMAIARRSLPTRRQMRPLIQVAVAVAVVELLNAINMLPLVQTGIQPEDTLYGFWMQHAAISAFSILVMFLTTAGLVVAADLLSYRVYPEHGHLGSWFTRRRLASREGLRALGVGYALIPLQLAYVSVFYWLVSRLGGWSPADVPYDDLFSTSMPWAFALLIGVTAAVSEEFLYRFVATSWLKRVTGRTWLAVLIPAMLWAFAHCNYPNQPFYIRGVELTVWGCIWGVVYIRLGPLPTLLSHAGFNALLVGESLLSSSVPFVRAQFYVVCLLVMLPALLALLWRRQNRFVSDESEEREEREAPATAGSGIPVPTEHPLVTAVTPLRSSDWRFGALLAAVSAAVIGGLYWFSERQARWRWPEERYFTTSVVHRTTAARNAREALRQRGLKPLNGYVALTMEQRTEDIDVVAYLRQYLSDADTNRLLDRVLAPPALWVFQEKKDLTEYRVRLRPDGSVYSVDQILPEQAPGEHLSKEVAQDRAEDALRQAGLNPQWLELKGHDVERLPQRSRHTFTWHMRHVKVGDARFVVQVSVDGRIAGSPVRYVEVPDRYLFERSRFRPEHLLGLVSLVLLLWLGIRAMVVWVSALRSGAVPWKAAANPAGWAVATLVALRLLESPGIWGGLSPDMPAAAYITGVAVSHFVDAALLVVFLVAVIGPSVILWRRCFDSPDVRTVWLAMVSPRTHRELWADAWMRAIYVMLIGLVIVASTMLTGIWPPSLPNASIPSWLTNWYVPPSITSQPVWWVVWPWLYEASRWLQFSVILTSVAAIALPVAKLSLRTSRLAWGVFLVLLLTSLPQQCRSLMEYTQTGVASVAVLYVLHHLARRVLMPNLLVAPVLTLYVAAFNLLPDCSALKGGWAILMLVLALWPGATLLAWRCLSRSGRPGIPTDTGGSALPVTEFEAGEIIRE